MKTTRKIRPLAFALRGLVVVVIGAAAFLGLEHLDRLLVASLEPTSPLPADRLPPARPRSGKESRDAASARREGNLLLGEAIIRLEQHASVVADVVQVGWIDGYPVEAQGVYQQLGAGAQRRFSLLTQGRLTDRPARLLRVSDGRFLWSDLWWAEAPAGSARTVTRVDLRRLRRELQAEEGAVAAKPGGAAASMIDPQRWARFGGLPMLLAGLDRQFDFGPPKLMQLRDRRVAASVGRWNPERLAELFAGAERGALPKRAPHHVVLALDSQTLFPLLVEYRGLDDPLAEAGLPDESLLRPSRRPMLKIDYLRPRIDAPLGEDAFAYAPPPDVRWQDQTDRELRIVKGPAPEAAVAQRAADGASR